MKPHSRGYFIDSFDSELEFRNALITTLQSRIQQIITDTPSTNNIAVLIVHESFTSQYKRALDGETKAIAELRKQLETEKNPVFEAEVTLHEVLNSF